MSITIKFALFKRKKIFWYDLITFLKCRMEYLRKKEFFALIKIAPKIDHLISITNISKPREAKLGKRILTRN